MALSVDCNKSTLKVTGMGKCWEPPKPKVKRLSSRHKRLKFIREKNALRLGKMRFRAALHVDFCKGIERAENQLASLHYQVGQEILKRYKLKLRNHKFKGSEFGLTILTMWN